MRVLLETRPDDTFDVTEDVKRVLDALHSSLDWGSGFLDVQQRKSATKLMKALGFKCFWEYQTEEIVGWYRNQPGFGYMYSDEKENPGGWSPRFRQVPCQRPYGHKGEHGQEES